VDLPLWVRVGGALALAALIAYLSTPMAIATARRYAFYDVPAGYKAHDSPTPYLGGLAVSLALAVALVVGAGHPAWTLPLLGGMMVMLVVGTVDDRQTVSPGARVAVELVLGVLVSLAGLGWNLGAGAAVDALATALWIVAVVNAFNLFDNMDGAASAMALVVAAGACLLALITSEAWAAAASAAVCGACLGFLPHNIASPARIFLGDGGSMPLGFVVAVVVASAARGAEASTLGLMLGILLVGIPLLDTCLVIVSRHRRRVPIWRGGRDHLTHRTRTRIGSARRVALLLGSVQAILSALVIVASRQGSIALAYVVLAFVACAATAIMVLETEASTAGAGIGDQAPASPLGAAEPGRGAPGVGTGATAGAVVLVGVVVLGLGAGLSAFWRGYYDTGVWLPIGLAMTIAAAAVTVARPVRLSLPSLLCIGASAGLGLFSLLSGVWASDVAGTTSEADLWLTYAALLLLCGSLLRGPREASALLVAAGAGVTIVAASVLVRMLGSDAGRLFLGGRLNAPLGYVNGEGCVFAMGCWMMVALAERREALVAGTGAAGAVALAGLTLLSQSRGAAVATVVALLVALAVIPGVRRRVFVLAVIGVAVGLAAPAVVHVYQRGQASVPPGSVVHSAAVAILLAAALAGLVWGVAVAATRRAAAGTDEASRRVRRVGSVLAVVIVIAPIAVALVRLPTIAHTVSTQWRAFTHVSDASAASAGAGSDTRLFSGAGNRYDYWRIAWGAFTDHPFGGLGAGNYARVYFRDRRTTEAVQNPHSIELQTLAELGLPGALLLAAFVTGAVIGAVRLRREATQPGGARTAMVAATGVAVVWFVDTSGDWMHLIPGVSAIALGAIAVLCRGRWAAADDAPGPHPGGAVGRALAVGGAALVLVIAGASLLRATVTERYLADARAELRAHPAAAITDANRALRLDPAQLDAYYVKAAALARFDRAAAAHATLLAAARHDPQTFVTWTLLGDLEVRRGMVAAARTYYRRAQALDPRDPALAQLVRDPAAALAR
jgi:UDP-GlcNAc:undecaprenyl-phosphate GlcNAc-1-phosphate transferase